MDIKGGSFECPRFIYARKSRNIREGSETRLPLARRATTRAATGGKGLGHLGGYPAKSERNWRTDGGGGGGGGSGGGERSLVLAELSRKEGMASYIVTGIHAAARAGKLQKVSHSSP